MEMVDADGVVTDDGTDLVKVEISSALAVARGEVEMQLDAAHKYPRSVRKFLSDAVTLATLDEETAAACMYSFKRGGKTITGPSVRCAEICISAWGNAHVGARVVAIEDKEIVAQGGAWDLEKNVKCVMETRRRITGKDGGRFSDDMIAVTGNAAASIALRNAIFKIVPRAYVQRVYDAARRAAVGDGKTLSEKRAKVMERLALMGATSDRVLAALGKPSVEDLTVDDVEVLIGYGSGIKNGDQKVDDVFPEVKAAPAAPAAEDVGRRMKLGAAKPPRMTIETPGGPPPEPGSDG